MGKTPGKWIKTLLLGKKSPKSNLVVSVKDDFSNLSLDPPPVAASSQPDTASTAQNVVAAPCNGDDLESRNDFKLEQAASKIQAVFRARQARRAIRTLKGIIRLQAVIRGHLVRRQAVATYSCIWGIVKFQALVRGRIARSSSSHNLIHCHKPHTEVNDSEALQVSMYSWMDTPTKLIIVDKLLASSLTALPLKIQYGPEEPNSAKVWLERWTQVHVWFPPPRAARILVPETKTKKRNYQAVVDSEKARPTKQGVKKQSGSTSGKVSNRSTAESEKSKRSVRKASTLSKDPVRTESDKAKQKSRKSRSASKEEVKEEKPRPSVKRSSLSNTSLKVTRKSAEKKKDIVQIEPEVKVSDIVEVGEDVESAEKEKDAAESAQVEPEVKVSHVLEGGGDAIEAAEKEIETVESVQIEPEVKVSGVLEGGNDVESAEKENDTADSVQIEPEMKVPDDLQGGGHGAESAEKEKDTTDVVPSELVEKENSQAEDELRTSETNDKGEEDLKCSDVKVSSENGNIASDNSKPSERRVSQHANDEGRTHSGRKVPSYMAPTASTLRRHSLPSPANGKPGSTTTTTMSPRAHKLLLASAKGSTNGDKSVSSSKNKTEKSNKTEWKR
ncbi:IQ-domain 28 [Hirschfeldia incana]|nr:IQ-domain 28 [Hirschfeldia incana]KAJ0256984.1 IQ-domain 28 [Hirschfeldia incana]